jgi:multidrug efflux system membrane fusion protein
MMMQHRTAALAAAIVLALAACKSAPPPPPPLPAVTVAPVLRQEITEWDEFTGRFQPVDGVEVRPRVSGYIRRVAFTEGREVKQGEVLFEIDPRPYAAELARAEAQLEQARTRATLAASDLTRAQRLVTVQAISREEFDSRTSGKAESEAAVHAAEAAVESARLNLEWTRVRAPISGRVSRAEVTPGNLVQAGPPTATLLTSVVSVDPIYVYFDADEATYLKYAALTRAGTRAGRPEVQLGLANEDGTFPHKGYVDFVDNQLDPRSGTIRLRAVFSNKERLFTPGLFARLKLVGSAPHEADLVVDRAVGTDQDRKFLLVLKPDSTVEYRPVQLGPLVDGLRVVTAGVKDGERIVINGLQRVRPGMHVLATSAPMAADSTITAAAAR